MFKVKNPFKVNSQYNHCVKGFPAYIPSITFRRSGERVQLPSFYISSEILGMRICLKLRIPLYLE